jgi:hypothetical protein
VTSRATSRGTRTRGVGEVVDDEPGVVDDERREEPRDEPRDEPRHPDAIFIVPMFMLLLLKDLLTKLIITAHSRTS